MTHALPTYYSLCETLELPLQPTLSMGALKQQYKKLALKYHPDKKPHGNNAKFKQIVHAYKCLEKYTTYTTLHGTTPVEHMNAPSFNASSLDAIIEQLLKKYNINININVSNLQHILSTIDTSNVFLKFQEMFNPTMTPTDLVTPHSHVGESYPQSSVAQPCNLSRDTINNINTTNTINTTTNTNTTINTNINNTNTNINTTTIPVTLHDIYNDSVLSVVIKTSTACKHYRVPALYESITFENSSESTDCGGGTDVIQLELQNDTMFEIYQENHLCVIHHVTILEYFTKIQFSFIHLNNTEIKVNIDNPHCTCHHYIDGVYCKYEQLGLPLEHQSTHRGDLYVFFNVRQNLDDYMNQ